MASLLHAQDSPSIAPEDSVFYPERVGQFHFQPFEESLQYTRVIDETFECAKKSKPEEDKVIKEYKAMKRRSTLFQCTREYEMLRLVAFLRHVRCFRSILAPVGRARFPENVIAHVWAKVLCRMIDHGHEEFEKFDVEIMEEVLKKLRESTWFKFYVDPECRQWSHSLNEVDFILVQLYPDIVADNEGHLARRYPSRTTVIHTIRRLDTIEELPEEFPDEKPKEIVEDTETESSSVKTV